MQNKMILLIFGLLLLVYVVYAIQAMDFMAATSTATTTTTTTTTAGLEHRRDDNVDVDVGGGGEQGTTGNSSDDEDVHYAVVIDAGSSGSRVHLYQYRYPSTVSPTDFSLQNKLPLVDKAIKADSVHGATESDWQKKITPGISTFGPKAPLVGEQHLKPLLDFATQGIPVSLHASTPIYLFATAGMRLLPKVQQESVLRETCSFFRGYSPFLLGPCSSHIKIISGEEEGLYGWLTVNYLLKGFQSTTEEARKPPSSRFTGIQAVDAAFTASPAELTTTTYGFLDMGGASAQIAYEPMSDLQRIHANDLYNLTLRGVDGSSRDYHIFITTFLGYGANEARKHYLDRLKEKQTAAAHELEDPCLPKDLTRKEVTAKHGEVTVKGAGNLEKCFQSTNPLLNKEKTCPEQPCLFDGVHTPGIRFDKQRFIGVSEYWYTSHEIYNLGGVYSHPKLLTKAQQFCSQPWSTLLEKLEAKEFGDTDSDRLQNQCFKSAWIMTVLHEGFGLPKEKTEDVEDRFQSVDSISGFSVSWTLGVALVHAVQRIGPNGIQSTSASKNLGSPAGGSASSSSYAGEFLLLFVLLAVVICMGSRWFLNRSADWKGSSSSSSSGVQHWLHQRNSYHPLSRLGSGGGGGGGGGGGSQGTGLDVEVGGLRSSGGSNGNLSLNGVGPYRNPFPTSNSSDGGTTTAARSSPYASGAPSGYSSSYVTPKYPLGTSASMGNGGGGGGGGPMKLMRE